jgi:uncharacterized coiled-coil protein SlyX
MSETQINEISNIPMKRQSQALARKKITVKTVEDVLLENSRSIKLLAELVEFLVDRVKTLENNYQIINE